MHPWTRVAVSTVIVVAVVVGSALRLWFVFHSGTTADEDVVGLIAQAGLHGHFQAFYGGQAYGGTAEPYLIAVAFALFGQTGVVAKLVLVFLSAVGSLLVWRIVLLVVGNRGIAALAAALSWGAPAVNVAVSTYVYGFRGATLVCGLALVLLAFRMLTHGPTLVEAAGLGIAGGVAWWSSPESAYFLVPALVGLGIAVVRTPERRGRTWAPPALVAAVAFALGALPWIWSNIRSGFASFDTSKFETSSSLTYGGRLVISFKDMVPMELGLRRFGDGMGTLGSATPAVMGLVIALVVVSVVLCIAKGGGALALAVGLLAAPFLEALSPLSWFWQDGRYGYVLPSLSAMVVSVGIFEIGRRSGQRPDVAVLGLTTVTLLSVLLCLSGVRQYQIPENASFATGWRNADRPASATADQLEHAGVRYGYADYWVAYKLDFLARGDLEVTPVGADTVRSPTISRAVQQSKQQAWIFVAPRQLTAASQAFGGSTSVIVGPAATPLSAFVARLQQLGIPYRTVETPLVTAILPSARVSPSEAGIAGATTR